MPSPLHSKQTIADGIHTPISYTFADAAALAAATGFTTEDKYKLALVLDTYAVMVLTQVSPPTWEFITNPDIEVPTTNSAYWWGNTSVGATTTPRYMTPGYGDDTAASAPTQFRAPFGGTLTKMRVRHNIPAGNGQNITYTVRINSVPTALFIVLGSTTVDSLPTNASVPFLEGDLIDIEVTKAGTIVASPEKVIVVLEVAP